MSERDLVTYKRIRTSSSKFFFPLIQCSTFYTIFLFRLFCKYRWNFKWNYFNLRFWRNKYKTCRIYFDLNMIYRVSQEECARLREGVPYVEVYRYNPKHLCPKLNGYGDNGQRKVWSSGGSTHCICLLTYLSMSVLECGVILRQFSCKAGTVF